MNRLSKSLLTCFLLSSLSVFAEEFSLDSMFDQSSDDHFEEILEQKKQMRGEDCPTPESILSLITPPDGAINLPLLLQQNIYKHTNPPHTRPLLSLPTLITYPIHTTSTECFPCIMRISGFYNQTHNMYFTKDSPYINSYIDFDNAVILKQLEEIKSFNIDVIPILDLFRNIKLQERRFGVVLGATGSRKRWSVTADLPLYYLEHNFYLSPKEEKAIENSPFLKNIQENSAETSQSEAVCDSAVDTRELAKQHLVNDKFGLGDSFLRIFYDVSYTDCQNTLLGLHVALPTAYTIKQKFFVGGAFNKDEPQPTFNFQDIANLALCDDAKNLKEAKAEGIAFLIGILDRLAANEVDLSLGNNGHFGFGPAIKLNRTLGCHWSAQLDGYAEYDIPSTETRYFLSAKNAEMFDRDYQNELLAAVNLQFLSTQFVNTFYPLALQTRVIPGVQAVLTGQVIGNFAHLHVRFGADYWYQGKEHVSFGCDNGYGYSELQVSKGLLSSAYQAKVLAEIGYKKEAKKIDWTVNLGSDYTVAHSGIGKDYTVVIGTRIFF